TTVFRQTLSNTDLTPPEIEILSDDRKKKLLYEFNDTRTPYPKDRSIHGLFEDQVTKTPADTAVSYPVQDEVSGEINSETFTYRQLNERADRLADQLRAAGVRARGIIGIMLERSIEIPLFILAVFKAGASYLPVDPEFPTARIQYMLNDSSAALLLTSGKTGGELNKLENWFGKIIVYQESDGQGKARVNPGKQQHD
ncbi:MAG: AMP-binding protein, partial [bacterium]|nr:AMP-binding protein [bacterium]